MKKIILLCLLLLFTTSCIQTTSSNSTSISSQLVISFNGEGDTQLGMSTKTTQSFHISESEWCIETNCEPLDSSNPVTFLISVFPKDKPVDNYSYVAIVSQTTSGMDRNYVHESGDFYLSIVAMNIKTWSIKVYE